MKMVRAGQELRARFVVTLGGLALVASGCGGTSVASLADSACEIARSAATGEMGFVAAGMAANSLANEARDAEIRIGDVLSKAMETCPEVAGELPF